MSIRKPVYEYVPPPGLSRAEDRKKVVIVGGGPIGVVAALELANHDMPTVVLERNNKVSVGSKAICWSKRSLEIFDRLGIGQRALSKGVTWQIGRTFHKDQELFNFDLLPEEGHKYPAFINLQQYYVEQFLVEQALAVDLIDMRFLNTVTDVQANPDHAVLKVETPDGDYTLESEYLVACDGVRSTIRKALGLEFVGELFEDRFLIADIEMSQEFPSERWFWFEPLFHSGQSALLHKQPDNIYRIDLQLGWGADPEEEKRPEKVIPRITKVVGHDNFKIDWVSVYTFQCRRLESFVHDRIIFAGDSAHVVSPFGARGGNGGIQDIDNLGWKLAAIIRGDAQPSLLASYNRERIFGADDNIAHSTRTTKFMTPADGIERQMRDQLFKLAKEAEFARSWINSGRLSVPPVYPCFEDREPELPFVARPGTVALDAKLNDGSWLIDLLGGAIVVLCIGCDVPKVTGCRTVEIEASSLVKERYLGKQPHAVYLIRPDQVVRDRWIKVNKSELQTSIEQIWMTG